MRILDLITKDINQNEYHLNQYTKNKIGFIFIAPVYIVPDDCLACDGYVLKIADYKNLYKIIGKKFNTGKENSDEFKIPDYNISKRFLQPGDNASTKIDAGLPNITGSSGLFSPGAFSGALCGIRKACAGAQYAITSNAISIDASKSNEIYGNSTTVQPNSQIVHLCIKYK